MSPLSLLCLLVFSTLFLGTCGSEHWAVNAKGLAHNLPIDPLLKAGTTKEAHNSGTDVVSKRAHNIATSIIDLEARVKDLALSDWTHNATRTWPGAPQNLQMGMARNSQVHIHSTPHQTQSSALAQEAVSATSEDSTPDQCADAAGRIDTLTDKVTKLETTNFGAAQGCDGTSSIVSANPDVSSESCTECFEDKKGWRADLIFEGYSYLNGPDDIPALWVLVNKVCGKGKTIPGWLTCTCFPKSTTGGGLMYHWDMKFTNATDYVNTFSEGSPLHETFMEMVEEGHRIAKVVDVTLKGFKSQDKFDDAVALCTKYAYDKRGIDGKCNVQYGQFWDKAGCCPNLHIHGTATVKNASMVEAYYDLTYLWCTQGWNSPGMTGCKLTAPNPADPLDLKFRFDLEFFDNENFLAMKTAPQMKVLTLLVPSFRSIADYTDIKLLGLPDRATNQQTLDLCGELSGSDCAWTDLYANTVTPCPNCFKSKNKRANWIAQGMVTLGKREIATFWALIDNWCNAAKSIPGWVECDVNPKNTESRSYTFDMHYESAQALIDAFKDMNDPKVKALTNWNKQFKTLASIYKVVLKGDPKEIYNPQSLTLCKALAGTDCVIRDNQFTREAGATTITPALSFTGTSTLKDASFAETYWDLNYLLCGMAKAQPGWVNCRVNATGTMDYKWSYEFYGTAGFLKTWTEMQSKLALMPLVKSYRKIIDVIDVKIKAQRNASSSKGLKQVLGMCPQLGQAACTTELY